MLFAAPVRARFSPTPTTTRLPMHSLPSCGKKCPRWRAQSLPPMHPLWNRTQCLPCRRNQHLPPEAAVKRGGKALGRRLCRYQTARGLRAQMPHSRRCLPPPFAGRRATVLASRPLRPQAPRSNNPSHATNHGCAGRHLPAMHTREGLVGARHLAALQIRKPSASSVPGAAAA